MSQGDVPKEENPFLLRGEEAKSEGGRGFICLSFTQVAQMLESGDHIPSSQ